jgi:tetratricopeptide (TPR) repeat protein
MPTPLCFILMPFGKKKDATGREIDFDAVYDQLIAPAIRAANMEPIRADEEKTGGIIHKPMFERLILCEFAVADLTAANANVFYELGVRHATRPHTTVLIFAEGSGQLPFDVAQLRAIPYVVGPGGQPLDVDKSRKLLADRLNEARTPTHDSPLYQLLENYPDIDHTKTDVFREVVKYSKTMKDRLMQARKAGLATIRDVETSIPNLVDCETGVVVDLFLSYRDVKGWDEMIALVPKMSPVLAATVMVQEQLALALNRAGRGEEAERVLLELIARRGPSSETYGILGRIYKDRWEKAKNAGQAALARGLLDKAIDAYLKGFEADWRDAYPGINAVTLMELKTPPAPRRLEILPVVTYAVKQRIARGTPDYWDYATLVELAVLANDEPAATDFFSCALATGPFGWMKETTSRNLRLIREERQRRGDNVFSWAEELERELAV